MKKLVIHIGVHKTGSSAIQYFMNNNRGVFLQKYKLNYPSMKNDLHHFQHNALVKLLKEGKGEKVLNFINEESFVSETVLLSSESFSVSTSTPDKLNELKESFDEITIIAYLRRQDLWLESVYRQLVKVERIKITETFNDWVDRFLLNPHDLYSCNWMELLSGWSSVFGINNIIVRPYEKSQFAEGNIIEDFLKALEIEYEMADFSAITNTYNRSFNLPASDFLRLMNDSSNIQKWRAFLNVLFRDPFEDTGEVYLTREKRQNILKHFNASNEEVVKTFLPENSNGLFIEPIPEKENYPPVFQALNKKEILPEIKSIIHDLDKAILQLEETEKNKT